MCARSAFDENKCPYCYSTKTQIVDSYERRDVMVILCLQCGKRSELDTENENVPPGTVDAPKETGMDASVGGPTTVTP